jgi:serine/threonine-protein kinase
MSDLPIDSIFAGYRIERVLGAGGMGTVYLARSPDLPRSEAIKVLSVELSRDPAFRARFIREADVAAGLDHPNIVSVYRRGEFDDKLWIAMQYVEGTDAEAAQATGSMDPPRALRIITEVGKALDYAHRRGVVHRDVKPANFLLSQFGSGDERVLLADFGIARALGDSGLTATGAVMATLAYAAPEVLAGGQFDGRADLYSLGCALYRLLTGKSPYFQADGAVAVMSAHLTQPPPKVTEVAPWLPPQIDWVIAKAMAKDPTQRFSSARELAEAASEAIFGPTARQRPAGVGTSMSTSPWNSDPQPAQRTYAAPTASSGSILPPMQGYSTMPGGHFGVQPSRRRRSNALAAVAAVVLLLAGGVTAWVLTSGSDSGPQPSTTASNSESTSATPSTATTVPNAALSGLLLPAAQAADLLGVPELVVSRTFTAIQDDSSPAVDLKECVSAALPAQYLVFKDSGWRAAVEQFLVPPGGSGSIVIQAVIAYPDAATAQKLARDQRETWTQCAGKTITTTTNAQSVQQTFGSVQSIDDNTIALPNTRPGGWTCQRALGVRNNIVIDVMACRIGVVDQGVDILKQIATKIST